MYLQILRRTVYSTTHAAGSADEHPAEALGVAGRPQDRIGTRVLQIQDGLQSKLEREDGF